MARFEVEILRVQPALVEARFEDQVVATLRGSDAVVLRNHLPGVQLLVEGELDRHRVARVVQVLGDGGLLHAAEALSAQGSWSELQRKLQHPSMESDRALLAFRVRAAQELEQIEQAAADFLRLMSLPEHPRHARSAPPVAELFGAFSPDVGFQLIPAIGSALRRGQLSLDAENTHRLMSQLPEREWPNGYLCHRARIEISPQVTQVILRELERRIADAPPDRERLEKALSHGRARTLQPAARERAGRADRAHPIFRSAADALRPATPSRVPHLGGPTPEIDVRAGIELVRWTLAELLDHFEIDALTQRAAALVAKGGGIQTFNELEQLRPNAPPPLFEAVHRAGAAILRPQPLSRTIKPAIRCAALLLQGTDRAASFLDGLDREIMRVEARSMLQRAGKRSGELEVLARGADERDKPAAWFLRIDDRHAFLARVRKSWIYEEGDRDSVLASVPDRWFDTVASALSG